MPPYNRTIVRRHLCICSLALFAALDPAAASAQETAPRQVRFSDTGDVVAGAAVGGLTVACIASWDEGIERISRESPNAFPYSVVHHSAKVAGWYGKSSRNAWITFGAVTGAVALAGIVEDDDYLLDTAGIMLESGAITFATFGVLKMIVGRHRPYVGAGAHKWEFFRFSGSKDFRSFPSGHTAMAFSMAAVGTKRYPDWWVQVPAYALATAAGFQRIDSRVHWTSDVIVGAVVGYVVSALIVDHETKDGADGGSPNLVSFSWQF